MPKSRSSTKKPDAEFVTFNNLLAKIANVPHSEIKAKLEAEKHAKNKRTKKSR